jgi:hypothetical protein
MTRAVRTRIVITALLTVFAAHVAIVGTRVDFAAAVSPRVYWAESSYDSSPFKGANAQCPAGHRVIGGGARIENGNGQVDLVRMEPLGAPTTPELYYAWGREKTWFRTTPPIGRSSPTPSALSRCLV